jgi:thioredoxin 1
MVLNLNDQTFEKEVLSYKGVVLVDFWAPWCGPCLIMGPVIEDLANEYNDKVKITKVNVDENQSLASQYGVMSIPTLLIFKNGILVGQFVGVQPKEVIKEKIDSLVSKDH